jgi:hypothetical protein
MPSQAGFYILMTAVIAWIGATISTLEWIAARRELEADGLFSWLVIRTRNFAVGSGPLAKGLDWILSSPGFLILLGVRLTAIALLPVAFFSGRGSFTVLSVVFLSTLLVNVRLPWGMDASDQMLTQVFGSLLLAAFAGTPLAYKATLWFIAGQSCLSYLASGVAKATSPYWQKGYALLDIGNTKTYGFEPLASFLLSWPTITRLLSWSVILLECAFPLVLLVGYPACFVFICWGIVFHLMIAFVMGLNSFLWAFGSTYPAIVFCSIEAHRFIGLR